MEFAREIENIVSQLSAAPSANTYENLANLLQPEHKQRQHSDSVKQNLPKILGLFRRDIDVNGDPEMCVYYCQIILSHFRMRHALRSLGYLTHDTLVGPAFTGNSSFVNYKWLVNFVSKYVWAPLLIALESQVGEVISLVCNIILSPYVPERKV